MGAGRRFIAEARSNWPSLVAQLILSVLGAALFAGAAAVAAALAGPGVARDVLLGFVILGLFVLYALIARWTIDKWGGPRASASADVRAPDAEDRRLADWTRRLRDGQSHLPRRPVPSRSAGEDVSIVPLDDEAGWAQLQVTNSGTASRFAVLIESTSVPGLMGERSYHATWRDGERAADLLVGDTDIANIAELRLARKGPPVGIGDPSNTLRFFSAESRAGYFDVEWPPSLAVTLHVRILRDDGPAVDDRFRLSVVHGSLSFGPEAT